MAAMAKAAFTQIHFMLQLYLFWIRGSFYNYSCYSYTYWLDYSGVAFEDCMAVRVCVVVPLPSYTYFSQLKRCLPESQMLSDIQNLKSVSAFLPRWWILDNDHLPYSFQSSSIYLCPFYKIWYGLRAPCSINETNMTRATSHFILWAFRKVPEIKKYDMMKSIIFFIWLIIFFSSHC